MRSNKYWDSRSLNRLTDSEKQSEKYIKNIQGIYNQAYRNIDREIASIYRNYSNETGIDTQKLKEYLTRSQTQKEWEQMKKQGLDQYVLDNYKSRITRMEQLQAQVYAKAKMIYPKEELQHTMCYKGILNNNYYKTMYDTQMGTGYDFAFATIDDNLINTLLNEKWSGKNYSERIWGNTDILANNLSTILGGALISGQSLQKTSKQIRDRFNVAKHYADRLVRTEANHFHNTADAIACEELGAKKYVFMATLDTRTSDICQQHDHKVFKYSERKEGVNFPPLHPNCRSTTRAYMGKDVEKELKRRARNPFDNTTDVINNTTYKDWAKTHKDNIIKHTSDGVLSFDSMSNNGIKNNFKLANKMIKFNNTNKTIYDRLGKLDVKVKASDEQGCYYSPHDNSVHLSNKINERNAGSTIHEMAHAVDFNLGKKLGIKQYSTSGNLTQLVDDWYNFNKGVLSNDVKNYLNSINDKVTKKTGLTGYLRNFKRHEFAEQSRYYDRSNRLSDMFSGLTKGDANPDLFAKHPKRYWGDKGTREMELYAQFTYLKMTNCRKELKLFEKVAPEVYNELERLYINSAKELRRLYG